MLFELDGFRKGLEVRERARKQKAYHAFEMQTKVHRTKEGSLTSTLYVASLSEGEGMSQNYYSQSFHSVINNWSGLSNAAVYSLQKSWLCVILNLLSDDPTLTFLWRSCYYYPIALAVKTFAVV